MCSMEAHATKICCRCRMTLEWVLEIVRTPPQSQACSSHLFLRVLVRIIGVMIAVRKYASVSTGTGHQTDDVSNRDPMFGVDNSFSAMIHSIKIVRPQYHQRKGIRTDSETAVADKVVVSN